MDPSKKRLRFCVQKHVVFEGAKDCWFSVLVTTRSGAATGKVELDDVLKRHVCHKEIDSWFEQQFRCFYNPLNGFVLSSGLGFCPDAIL